jgi:hypothetical protein
LKQGVNHEEHEGREERQGMVQIGSCLAGDRLLLCRLMKILRDLRVLRGEVLFME